jgi:hypothetical protein
MSLACFFLGHRPAFVVDSKHDYFTYKPYYYTTTHCMRCGRRLAWVYNSGKLRLVEME